MKMLTLINTASIRKAAGSAAFAVALVLAFSHSALAQSTDYNSSSNDSAVAGGDLRAPSPRIMDPNRPGYFQLGVGPAFGIGLGTDRVMYDVNAAYAYNFGDRFTGKLLANGAFGSESDTARWVNLGVGGDFYLQEIRIGYGIPYLMADVNYGFVRHDNDETQDAAAIGAGAGFKFAAESLNLDVNIHYAVLTEQIAGGTPSLLGLRAALSF